MKHINQSKSVLINVYKIKEIQNKKEKTKPNKNLDLVDTNYKSLFK